MSLNRFLIFIPLLLSANIEIQGAGLKADFQDIDALVYDFMHKPITKGKCKEYSVCAEELKLSATNRIDS